MIKGKYLFVRKENKVKKPLLPLCDLNFEILCNVNISLSALESKERISDL